MKMNRISIDWPAPPPAPDYNDLIPPSNPDYPWVADNWQPLCYYCNQPIEMSKPWAGYRQRVIWHWEHVNPATSGNQYIKGSKWHCDPAKLRPKNEIDDPRCTCGAQEAGMHGPVCSAAGKPPYHATPLSNKEAEVMRAAEQRAAYEKEKGIEWQPEKGPDTVNDPATVVGTFVIAGTAICLLLYLARIFGKSPTE